MNSCTTIPSDANFLIETLAKPAAYNKFFIELLNSIGDLRFEKSAKGRILIGELLHYLPPLVVLCALIVYSRIAKQKNMPKLIYWITMVAGGFLLMSLLRI